LGLANKKKKVWKTEEAVVAIQALWRGFTVRRTYKPHIFRAKVAREIYTSEVSYADKLEKLLTVFFIKLQAELGKNIDMPQADYDKIFANIGNILNTSKLLSFKLKKKVDRWHLEQTIGDVFIDLEQIKFFEVYGQYVQCYYDQQETLALYMREEAAFEKLVKASEEKMGFILQSFFITPIQRVMRYVLLLQTLLKYTPTDHVEYKNLESSLHAMQQLVTKINEAKRKSDLERERKEQLKRVDALIYKGLRSSLSSEESSRVFLKEANLKLYDTDRQKFVEFHYFLFDDLMLLTEKRPRKGFKVKHRIDKTAIRKGDGIQNGEVVIGQKAVNSVLIHTNVESYFISFGNVADKEQVVATLLKKSSAPS